MGRNRAKARHHALDCGFRSRAAFRAEFASSTNSALSGVAVLNGLVMLGLIRHLSADGLTLDEAITRGALGGCGRYS